MDRFIQHITKSRHTFFFKWFAARQIGVLVAGLTFMWGAVEAYELGHLYPFVIYSLCLYLFGNRTFYPSLHVYVALEPKKTSETSTCPLFISPGCPQEIPVKKTNAMFVPHTITFYLHLTNCKIGKRKINTYVYRSPHGLPIHGQCR